MGKGVVFYRGASPVDGAPIIGVATWGSRNGKTGALTQTWIMRADIPPHEAVASGADVSVCGGCSFRPFTAGAGRRCYVQVFNAPLAVWRCAERGGYADVDPSDVPGPVRAGSYGDPAMIPADVWRSMDVVTGYTHQWRRHFADGHRPFLMASCDGPGDYRDATAQGWRALMVAPPDAVAPEVDGAVQCPSGRGVTCADCRLCGGADKPAKNVWIPAHGATARREQRGLLAII